MVRKQLRGRNLSQLNSSHDLDQNVIDTKNLMMITAVIILVIIAGKTVPTMLDVMREVLITGVKIVVVALPQQWKMERALQLGL